jgi:hypothetical protein
MMVTANDKARVGLALIKEAIVAFVEAHPEG